MSLPENATELINEINRGVMPGKLRIEIEEWTLERVVGTMPVEGNEQSDGTLAGGAMMSFAETLASVGAAGVARWPERIVMGQSQSFNLAHPPIAGQVRALRR